MHSYDHQKIRAEISLQSSHRQQLEKKPPMSINSGVDKYGLLGSSNDEWRTLYAAIQMSYNVE